jgi:pimeloyl-ACP methyl ester carboxylesterase
MAGRYLILAALCLVSTVGTSQKLTPGPQVLTFFSDADDTEQPYGLYLPSGYSESKKYPLVIMLHGAGSNHRLALRRVFGKSNANGETDVEASRYFPEWKDVEYIVASPYARGTAGYQGIPEKDVYDVLNDVKKRFSVDEDRIYLTGLSMGGGGTLWIGLTRPDLWAALAPVCPAPPAGTEQYTSNALNIPMHFYHGDQDRAVPVSVSRDWVKRIRELGGKVEYDEYPGVDHNSWENAYSDGAIFKWFDQFRRNSFPDEVRFSTAQHKYNKAYWVRIHELVPGAASSVNAKFNDVNELIVTASNTNAFTLRLAGHPRFQAGKALSLTLNGKKLKVTSSDSLTLLNKDGKWMAGTFAVNPQAKKAGSEGPIRDAFSQRHIYVYGTADNPAPDKLKERMGMATKAANWSVYRNAFLGRIMFFPRIVADKDVRPSDIESSNLILFGTKETNSLISGYADRLPLHLSPDASDLSLFYVFPIGNRYVAVNSGLPWWTTKEFNADEASAPPPHSLLNKLKDFHLFKGNSDVVLIEGYFDERWKLSEEQKKKLTESGVSVSE